MNQGLFSFSITSFTLKFDLFGGIFVYIQFEYQLKKNTVQGLFIEKHRTVFIPHIALLETSNDANEPKLHCIIV